MPIEIKCISVDGESKGTYKKLKDILHLEVGEWLFSKHWKWEEFMENVIWSYIYKIGELADKVNNQIWHIG